MKNRIRLGISSVSNRLKNPGNSVTRPMSISEIAFDNVPLFTGNFSSVSSNDLDEMFDKNLRLLNELEKDELSSNVSNKSQRYQSSLNIYISPQKSWRHSTGTYYSNCDVISLGKPQKKSLRHVTNNSSQLTKSPLYSSYETLYDNLKLRKNTQGYQNDESKSQSLIDTSSRSINEFLNIKGNKSSDSDRTLKSLTSTENDDSSSVSSIESQGDTKEISFKNYKTSVIYLRNVYQSNGNPRKLNSISSGMNSRPTSCYVDSKFGLYTPRSNLIAIRNQEMKDKSNVVISKPIGHYPSRSNIEHLSLHNTHNSNQTLSFQSDGSFSKDTIRKPVRINDKHCLSIKSSQNHSTNILNNHLVSLNNPIPISYSKSYTNISSSNKYGKQIPKNSEPSRRSYIGCDEKISTRKLIKVNSIEQNKQMNISALNDNNNSKIPNQNFQEVSIQPVQNGDRNFRDEENFISTSRCYQIQRTKKT